MEIRSYRRVFDLERRIYRIDRLRLNPSGVPVRGVVYFLAILLTALIARRLPLLEIVARLPPWYLGDLAIPAASAALLTMIRVEGRPFHLAALALARYGTGPRRLAGACRSTDPAGRWYPDEIVLLPDGSDGRMRRLRYTGPGAVRVGLQHERSDRASERGLSSLIGLRRSPALTLRGLADGGALNPGEVIALAPGARLLVRSDPGLRWWGQ
jgi:hypothetical protein